MQLPGDALYLIGGLALLLGAVLPAALSRRALSVPMAFVGVGVLVGLLPLPGGAPISPGRGARGRRAAHRGVRHRRADGRGAGDRPPVARCGPGHPPGGCSPIGMPLFVVVAAAAGLVVAGSRTGGRPAARRRAGARPTRCSPRTSRSPARRRTRRPRRRVGGGGRRQGRGRRGRRDPVRAHQRGGSERRPGVPVRLRGDLPGRRRHRRGALAVALARLGAGRQGRCSAR